jgi:hypothetical protein
MAQLALFGNVNIAPSLKVAAACDFSVSQYVSWAARGKISLTSETKNFLFGALSKEAQYGSVWLSLHCLEMLRLHHPCDFFSKSVYVRATRIKYH